MPNPIPNAEKIARIEATGRIVASVVQSGKVECTAEAVCEYFDKIYSHIVQSTKN